MSRIPTITTQKQQHGVVLVVSLMILLVLTLLGISSLDGSIMEEKMASNAQTASITFQTADSAIRETFYVESRDPTGAFINAERGDTARYDDAYDDASHDIAAGTVMAVPNIIKSPIYNYSAGIFRAESIEITGTANVGAINSSNTQGYRIFPMLLDPNKS